MKYLYKGAKMTWVVGIPKPYGIVEVISDIQVSWKDPKTGKIISTKDCLKKLYCLEPFLALGFAGSVAIGFLMLNDLQRYLAVNNKKKKDSAWKPDWVAGTWHKRVQNIFEKAPKEERELRCELMLIGVYPNKEPSVVPGWDAIPYIIEMRSPEFKPLCFASWTGDYYQIGSGTSHFTDVIENAKFIDKKAPITGSMDKYGNKEIFPSFSSVIIQQAVKENPTIGISEFMHSYVFQYGKESRMWQAPNMPPVATNWKEFQEFCIREGLLSGQAVC